MALLSLRVAVHAAILASLSFILSGCLLSYLVKSGYEQMSILSRRVSIEDALKDEKVPEREKKKLKLALEAREFAINELGLKPTENYKTYVDLKRPYVSYIVTAAKKFRLESYLYSFPIVGKLPYKGYFDKNEAEEEAKKFDRDLYDVQVRGVTAYSTLGWFEDPLLNTMLDGDDHHLVNLIIHESIHANLYIKSQADFNERLATFLGNKGTELFYLNKEGAASPTLKLIKAENDDETEFSKFLSKELSTLKAWYKTLPEEPKDDRDKLLKEREARFEGIVARFKKDVLPRMKTSRFKHFGSQRLSNATLMHLSTYMGDLNDFEKAYERSKSDFKSFFSFCKSLEKKSEPLTELRAFSAGDLSLSEPRPSSL